MRFKLAPNITGRFVMRALVRNDKGKYEDSNCIFMPNAEYETSEFEDKTPDFERIVSNHESNLPNNRQNREMLDSMGVEYRTTGSGCMSCGNKPTVIRYKSFMEV